MLSDSLDDDLQLELSSEKFKENSAVWSNRSSVIMLSLIFIISCAALLLLGYYAYVNVSEQLSNAVQTITDSDKRVDQHIRKFQSTLLKEISEGRKEEESHQQIVTQTISQLQKDVATLGPQPPISAKVVDKVAVQQKIDQLQKEMPPSGQQPLISEKVVDKVAAQKKSIVPEEKTIELKRGGEQLCFKRYHANDNDTLWKIAERFYGSGKWYPAILFHNPDLSIYQISHANRIRYLCDRSMAHKLYEQQIFRKKRGALKGLFWRYTVRQGDTLMNLQNRYCPRNIQGTIQTECCMDIDGKTGLTVLPEPGTKILIRLE